MNIVSRMARPGIYLILVMIIFSACNGGKRRLQIGRAHV